MSGQHYFYDSYAVLAYTSGHEAYKKYFEERDGVLTKLNLLEIFYRALEEYNSKVAKDIVESFYKYHVDYDAEDISGSMRLRLELKRKGLDISYADALGYFLALKLGLKFLTGDRAFKGLKGVEYVL
ncbi:MAG: PIN domain-containing protein [Nitrososphaerales archaeon]